MGVLEEKKACCRAQRMQHRQMQPEEERTRERKSKIQYERLNLCWRKIWSLICSRYKLPHLHWPATLTNTSWEIAILCFSTGKYWRKQCTALFSIMYHITRGHSWSSHFSQLISAESHRSIFRNKNEINASCYTGFPEFTRHFTTGAKVTYSSSCLHGTKHGRGCCLRVSGAIAHENKWVLLYCNKNEHSCWRNH